MELNEKQLDLYKRIQQITFTDYELKANELKPESIWNMVEDLFYEIEHLEEELEDIKQDIEANYRPISQEEQIGFNYDS